MRLIDVEYQNHVAIVRLNRPKKRNAMSFELLKQLLQTAEQLKKNRHLRCVILTGEAQVFSAGIDLADLNSSKNMLFATWQQIKPGQSLFQKAFLVWQQLPFPVIAAIEGFCFGAGMQLALAADIRIAHPETQMSIMESRWGLVPDMGLTRSLKGLIPIDLAKELTLTARVFDGQYAKDIGLVTHVSSTPLAHALKLAEEMSQRSPDALTAAKQVLDAMLHIPQHSLRLEKIWQLKLLLGKNSRLARQKDKHPDIQFLPRQY
jgi:enoyl-CoA hydratase/carnithine racemase